MLSSGLEWGSWAGVPHMARQGLESPHTKDEEVEAEGSHGTCLRSPSPNKKTRKQTEPKFTQPQRPSSLCYMPCQCLSFPA